MLKKIKYVVDYALIISLLISFLKFIGVFSSIPKFITFWPLLISLIGIINIIEKKKLGIKNLSLVALGIFILITKLGIVIY